MEKFIQDKLTMHHHASYRVFENAKKLRKNLTSTEKIMWDELKEKKLGVKFRKQHPIGIYVVDFYSHEIGLVIELDGEYHSGVNQSNMDKIRTENILSSGLIEIRFKDSEVLSDLEMVISKINDTIQSIKNPSHLI